MTLNPWRLHVSTFECSDESKCCSGELRMPDRVRGFLIWDAVGCATSTRPMGCGLGRLFFCGQGAFLFWGLVGGGGVRPVERGWARILCTWPMPPLPMRAR